jgi:hypothetical protein
MTPIGAVHDILDYVQDTPQWDGDPASTVAAIAADLVQRRIDTEFPHLAPCAELVRGLAARGARAGLEGGDMQPYALAVTALACLPAATTVRFQDPQALGAASASRLPLTQQRPQPITCVVGDEADGVLVPTCDHPAATIAGPWHQDFPADHPLLAAIPMRAGFWLLVDQDDATIAAPDLVIAALAAAAVPAETIIIGNGPRTILPGRRVVNVGAEAAVLDAHNTMLWWLTTDVLRVAQEQGVDPTRYRIAMAPGRPGPDGIRVMPMPAVRY